MGSAIVVCLFLAYLYYAQSGSARETIKRWETGGHSFRSEDIESERLMISRYRNAAIAGGIGAVIGSFFGVAGLGTAIAGTIPFAVVGYVIGYMSVSKPTKSTSATPGQSKSESASEQGDADWNTIIDEAVTEIRETGQVPQSNLTGEAKDKADKIMNELLAKADSADVTPFSATWSGFIVTDVDLDILAYGFDEESVRQIALQEYFKTKPGQVPKFGDFFDGSELQLVRATEELIRSLAKEEPCGWTFLYLPDSDMSIACTLDESETYES